MATKKPARIPAAVKISDAEAEAKEHAAFLAAGQDPAIVNAANITNGMPADEVKRRILAVVFAATPAEG